MSVKLSIILIKDCARQFWRERVAIVFIVATFLAGLGLGLLCFLSPIDSQRIVWNGGFSCLDLLAIYLTITCAKSVVLVSSGTAFGFLLSQPLSSQVLLISRFLGLATIISLVILFAAIILGGALFAGLSLNFALLSQFIYAALLIIIQSCLLISLTMLLSLLCRPQVTIFLVIGLLIAGRATTVLQSTAEELSAPLLGTFLNVMVWIIPDFSLFTLHNQAFFGYEISFTTFLTRLAYAVAYSATLLALTSWRLRNLPNAWKS